MRSVHLLGRRLLLFNVEDGLFGVLARNLNLVLFRPLLAQTSQFQIRFLHEVLVGWVSSYAGVNCILLDADDAFADRRQQLFFSLLNFEFLV
jgi:hypothetical protein